MDTSIVNPSESIDTRSASSRVNPTATDVTITLSVCCVVAALSPFPAEAITPRSVELSAIPKKNPELSSLSGRAVTSAAPINNTSFGWNPTPVTA